MDAISFVLGEKTSNLRVKKLSVCIIHLRFYGLNKHCGFCCTSIFRYFV